MPENYEYILVERDEAVGIVTLNRPKELNALSTAMVAEVASALSAFDHEESIHCMIITGAGDKAFAAGADIKEMADRSPVDMLLGGFTAWEKLQHLRKPLIAAVGGYALGGGCELAMHCDLIVAAEHARFGQPEITLGIIPGAGGTQRLARTLGKFVTMEMVLNNRQFSAQEMAERGLVNRVVPRGEHLSEALKIAREIAARAPIAVRLAKEAVQAAFETSLQEGLEHERKNFFLLFATEDMREGMRAFIEKRPPRFQGQ
jgi:enoyl-CoA hydratase